MATYIYERVTIGLGDAIMLRPAIIGNIKNNPNDEHILHTLGDTADIYSDIDGLQITKIFSDNLDKRYQISKNLACKYKSPIIFKLSTPCASREDIENPLIYTPRQKIYCDVVGVEFDINNYNMRFTDAESQYADDFIADKPNAIILHLDSNESWREYKYKKMLIDYFAENWDGHILLMGVNNYKNSKYDNVHPLNFSIRLSLAVVSKCQALVGIDSFGVHASGSCGTFTFGLFGPTNPKIRLLYKNVSWLPEYKYCKYQYCWYNGKYLCKNHWCLNTYTPQMIYDYFVELFNRRNK